MQFVFIERLYCSQSVCTYYIDNQATMSSVEYLRVFVSERLTAAAEEIFGVFKKTIVEYEEEIARQRKLLDVVLRPEIHLRRIELPLQYIYQDEEDLAEQQLCIEDGNFSPDQEDEEPPQIKKEQEELHTVQVEEQLVLKHETEAFMVTPTDEENEHSEDHYFNSYETLSAANKEYVSNIPSINYVVPDPSSNQQVFSHNFHKTESQNQKSGKHGDSGSTINATEQNKTHHNQSNITCNIHRDTPTGLTFYTCDTCGREFKNKTTLNRHFRVHTSERPYFCNTCGRTFKDIATLRKHESIHTGEKPYPCQICGKHFRLKNDVTNHMRTHTDERPHVCNICGKRYRRKMDMKWHMRMHTRDKQSSCETWGISEETLQLA
ncbi:zinc finger protein Gfi-1b-like isoform X2 [Eleginops maclovinus]|uniref:zinc finger protein Gfi-1b-like isoform X2 n=1 Tax=Eleginops maclovinus TaxID=56733 RepID=UPI003080D1E3